MGLIDQEPELTPRPGLDGGSNSARRQPVWVWLLVALSAVLAFLLARELRRTRTELARLGRQTEELNARLNDVERQSHTAAEQARQAAQSAETAARGREQAEKARAQSQSEAQQAQQQAASARQQATLAEQKAAQYRQEREQEITRLQEALGQIADTRRTAIGLVVTLGSNSIRFDFDKAEIKPQYRETLSRIAGVLMSVRGYSIHIFGYTDDVGTRDYNVKLSERRAQAVRDYLLKAGLDPKIITIKGYGKSDPRVSGDGAEARAKNRRVEIGLVDSTLRFEGPSN